MTMESKSRWGLCEDVCVCAFILVTINPAPANWPAGIFQFNFRIAHTFEKKTDYFFHVNFVFLDYRFSLSKYLVSNDFSRANRLW